MKNNSPKDEEEPFELDRLTKEAIEAVVNRVDTLEEATSSQNSKLLVELDVMKRDRMDTSEITKQMQLLVSEVEAKLEGIVEIKIGKFQKMLEVTDSRIDFLREQLDDLSLRTIKSDSCGNLFDASPSNTFLPTLKAVITNENDSMKEALEKRLIADIQVYTHFPLMRACIVTSYFSL